MTGDRCCGCNKEFFGPRGIRLVDKCYQIGIQAKVRGTAANGGKYYSDRSLAHTFLCEDCFNKPAAQVVRLLKPVIDNAQACERLSSRLTDDDYGSFIPV